MNAVLAVLYIYVWSVQNIWHLWTFTLYIIRKNSKLTKQLHCSKFRWFLFFPVLDLNNKKVLKYQKRICQIAISL